jgi:predicted KAP-like P-loop ATPase
MWSDNETSSDLLGCQHVVEVVTSIIKDESLLPATIGVFGDWGSGKSSLLQIVQEKLQETEQDKKDILVLAFNGWTFEGYEDARTALMSTILDEVASKATLTAKGRRLAVKLLGRINVMRVLGAGAKAALAFGMGGPVGLGLSAGADLATNAATLLRKAGEISADDLEKFIKEEPTQEVRRSIREFRRDFEELIDDTRLQTLVVIIDDLDRCMPDTIIETLEAIKLFLFAHKTAFILGADERLVNYAVRKRFPELPGERVEVGRDYLEKLVQFPVRVPPLGRTEIETYINLLFAKTGGLTPEQFEEARKRATTCNATSLLDVRFNHGVAAEILKGSLLGTDKIVR